MMTLSKFIKNDMDELYKKYRGKILCIVGKTEKLIVDEGVLFNSDLCFSPKSKTEYKVEKNKSLGWLYTGRKGKLFKDITKEELDKIISECEEKGYLIVGKENIL